MINTVCNLTIVILILVLSISYLPTASAEITINDNTIHVETNNYKVQFDYGAITYLHNKLTDETYTLPLESTYLISGGYLKQKRKLLGTSLSHRRNTKNQRTHCRNPVPRRR